MKIALLTKYGELAASTRQRFLQYRPFLEEAGFELVPRPLLDDAYLERLYAGDRRKSSYVATRYLERTRWLLSSPDVDIIWLHCESFPYLPGLLERLAGWPGKPVVFDFDDAIFHNYDQHPKWQIRRFLGSKLHSTIGAAEMAFCGNKYLAEYARPLCSQTEIVPTVVDTEIFLPSTGKRLVYPSKRIGWIGTPSTWNEYLLGMLPMLHQIAETNGGQIAVMGADRKVKPHPHLDLVKWSKEGEVPFLQTLDVGIMPLTDTPWARGKCGYKLIQYMACSLPVIASPVGVNKEIVEHGINGFLAETHDEWVKALNTLLGDADLRQRMGAAGRAKVEREYSLQVYGPKVANLLSGVLEANVGKVR